MRKTMRRSAGVSACAAAVSFCSATAHETASTTEPNSTMAPSPISLTMRPLMLGQERVDDLGAQPADRGERARLVLLDQPRIADDVGGEDRRQPPLDRASVHVPSFPADRSCKRSMPVSAAVHLYARKLAHWGAQHT